MGMHDLSAGEWQESPMLQGDSDRTLKKPVSGNGGKAVKVIFPLLVLRLAPLTGAQKSRSMLCHRVWETAGFSGTMRVKPVASREWLVEVVIVVLV